MRGFSAGQQLSPSLSGRNWRFLSSHPISPSHRGHVLPKVLVRNWEASAQEAAGLAGAVALGCALPPGALTVPHLSLCREGAPAPPAATHGPETLVAHRAPRKKPGCLCCTGLGTALPAPVCSARPEMLQGLCSSSSGDALSWLFQPPCVLGPACGRLQLSFASSSLTAPICFCLGLFQVHLVDGSGSFWRVCTQPPHFQFISAPAPGHFCLFKRSWLLTRL